MFPVAWITAASPLAAVLITPLIARMWHFTGDRQPSPVTKFAIDLVQIGFAYFFFLLVSELAGDAYIPIAFIILVMAIAGFSEVFVGPIGLSIATRIGPKAFPSQLVGLNFLTLGLGSSDSGLLGQLFTGIDESTYYMIIAGTGILLGLALFLVRKPLSRGLNSGL